MRVANDVGEPFAHNPTEQFLVGGVDSVDGAGEVGGDAGGPQQLSPGGELPRERHVPVIGDSGPHVGKRPSGEALHLGDLLQRPRRVSLTELTREAGFDGDRRQRVAEQVAQVAGDPEAFILCRQARELRARLGERAIALQHLGEVRNPIPLPEASTAAIARR